MKLLLIGLLLTIFVSCKQKEIDMNQLVERNKTFYEVNSDKPFDGIARTFYDNKQIKEEYYFDNGKRDGDYTRFEENGQKGVTGEYSKNMRDGDWVVFHSNGQKGQEITYKDDQIDGKVIIYYDNGQIKSEGEYMLGKRTGKHFEKELDGTLEWDGEFIDDKRTGHYRKYNHGILIQDDIYIDNNRNGLSIEYYSKDKVKSKQNYLNDKPNGSFEIYFENGKLCQKGIVDSFGVLNSVSYYNQQGQKMYGNTIDETHKHLTSSWVSTYPKNLQTTGYTYTRAGVFYTNNVDRQYTLLGVGFQLYNDYTYSKFNKVKFDDGSIGYIDNGHGSYYISHDSENDRRLPNMYVSFNDMKFYISDLQKNSLKFFEIPDLVYIKSDINYNRPK